MKQNTLNKKILFTGGGSGGHVSAALAIISELKDRYSNLSEMIFYVGGNLPMEGEKSSKSLEEKILSDTDIRFISIRSGKLQRYFSLSSIKLLFGVLGGFIDSMKVLNDEKPDMIFSTGGFVTVPVCIVGKLKGVPVYIHEQTANVGLTNKITGKFADKIFVSFKGSKKYFNEEKVVHVGNTIRPQIFDQNGVGEIVDVVKKMQTKRKELPVVLIAGGGQGSHILNITIRQMMGYLPEHFQVLLQTGDNQVNRDYEIMMKEKKKLPPQCQDRFHPVKFIDAEQIGYVFGNIDMYVGRSGANFVYEMGVLQIPSIFIPIPWVTNNEQYENAKMLADLGLAKILPEGELSAERLLSEMKRMNEKIKNNNLKVDKLRIEKEYPVDAAKKLVDHLPLN